MNEPGEKYNDLQYQETLRILKENGKKDHMLKFHLSNYQENYHAHSSGERTGIDPDMPDSRGDLEEETTGP